MPDYPYSYGETLDAGRLGENALDSSIDGGGGSAARTLLRSALAVMAAVMCGALLWSHCYRYHRAGVDAILNAFQASCAWGLVTKACSRRRRRVGSGFSGVPGADDSNGAEAEEDDESRRERSNRSQVELDVVCKGWAKNEKRYEANKADEAAPTSGQWTVSLELDGEAFRLRVPRHGIDTANDLKRAVVVHSLKTLGAEATPQPWLDGELSTMAIQFIHAEVCAL